MSKSLLTGRFKWLDLAKFNLNKYDNDRLRCYGLEVDLEYPKNSMNCTQRLFLISR